jgi:hypothetical protein
VQFHVRIGKNRVCFGKIWCEKHTLHPWLANALVRSEDLVSAMTGSFELDLGVCRVDLFHNSKAAQVKSPEIGWPVMYVNQHYSQSEQYSLLFTLAVVLVYMYVTKHACTDNCFISSHLWQEISANML